VWSEGETEKVRPPAIHTSGSKKHYRAFVGEMDRYDVIGAFIFSLTVSLGLRDHHRLLDIGCGSLRAGRLFIPYLNPGCYHGTEPEKWLVDKGIEKELGRDIVKVKQPTISHRNDFSFSHFGTKFKFAVAYSIFTHACPSQIKECCEKVAKTLRGSGIFVFSFINGFENSTANGWTYPDCV
jgi:hypothetical protein